MNATGDTHTLTVRQKVAAPATELFDAWLDSAKLAAWMRPSNSFPDIKIDPRSAANRSSVRTPGKIPHTGAYQVIDRARRLVFTWNSPASRPAKLDRDAELQPPAATTRSCSARNLPDAGEIRRPHQGAQHTPRAEISQASQSHLTNPALPRAAPLMLHTMGESQNRAWTTRPGRHHQPTPAPNPHSSKSNTRNRASQPPPNITQLRSGTIHKLQDSPAFLPQHPARPHCYSLNATPL